MSKAVSAASLVDAILRLNPASAPLLRDVTEGLATGTIGMQAFCAVVRQRLGGTMLLEALIMLQGGQALPNHNKGALLMHAQSCPGCAIPGCTQLRTMLGTLRSHCAQCAAPTECADPPHAGPLLARKVKVAARAKEASKEATGAALMMLARSALGDITSHSPQPSPVNSPNNSPLPKRRKAQRFSAEGGLARGDVENASAHEVVHATTVEATRHAAPARLRPTA